MLRAYRIRSALALLTAVLLALGAAACGSDDDGGDGGGSDPERAQEVAQAYSDALEDADAEAICETISPTLLAQAEKASGEPCVEGVGADLAGFEGQSFLGEAESAEVTGDTAAVTFSESGTLMMVREDGEWYVDLRPSRGS